MALSQRPEIAGRKVREATKKKKTKAQWRHEAKRSRRSDQVRRKVLREMGHVALLAKCKCENIIEDMRQHLRR